MPVYVFPLFRWDRTAESPIRDWPISTRERVHARQYRLPGDRRRGGRDGRVHPRENGFPRENQGYVTQSGRRVRVVHFHFYLFFPFFVSFLFFFTYIYRDKLFCFHSTPPSKMFPTHREVLGKTYRQCIKKKNHTFQSSQTIFSKNSMMRNDGKSVILVSFKQKMFKVTRE